MGLGRLCCWGVLSAFLTLRVGSTADLFVFLTHPGGMISGLLDLLLHGVDLAAESLAFPPAGSLGFNSTDTALLLLGAVMPFRRSAASLLSLVSTNKFDFGSAGTTLLSIG